MSAKTAVKNIFQAVQKTVQTVTQVFCHQEANKDFLGQVSTVLEVPAQYVRAVINTLLRRFRAVFELVVA